MSHHVLDATRLLCPMPVIRTQNLVASLAKGDTVDVLCTDPGAKNDIPAWCRIHGHEIINTIDADNNPDNNIVITVKVGCQGQ